MFPFILVTSSCVLNISAPGPEPLYIVDGYHITEPVLAIDLGNCTYVWGWKLEPNQ